MNTHNRIVLAAAVALGLVAGAVASNHTAPAAAIQTVHQMPETTLPAIVITAHREAETVATLEPIMITAHVGKLARANVRSNAA